MSQSLTTRPIARALVIAGLIKCLCFSVGEGLQLGGFPILSYGDTKTGTGYSNSLSIANSYVVYGPLDIPIRVSRGKRASFGHVFLTHQKDQYSRPQRTHLWQGRAHHEVCSVYVATSMPGRAPPIPS